MSAEISHLPNTYHAPPPDQPEWQTANEPDPFDAYDVNTFYTSRRNGEEMTTVSVNIPVWLAKKIGTVVEKAEVSQYSCKGDFFKDAAYHRMKYVCDGLNDEELAAQWQTRFSHGRLDNITADSWAAEKYATDAEEQMMALFHRGDKMRLGQMIVEVERHVSRAPDMWAEKLSSLAERYRDLL